ncbi:hypothetical protein AB0I60_20610 [Actinosynnema sp. NPDC050436]|uniref:hypothetical protein n=1 Tax=Actinosynnema sp. NPDC050436 TaxID=3155659 RepID=UPI0033C1DF40
MTSGRRIVTAWSALSADELGEQVRAHVRVTDGTTRAVWAAVRDDQVLRARVRGALSGLKAEFRGHRDEAMWLLWITRVQQQLTVEPPPATAAEIVSDRADDAWATALDAPEAADAGADAAWDAAVQTSDGGRPDTGGAENGKSWAATFGVPATAQPPVPVPSTGLPSNGVPATGLPSTEVPPTAVAEQSKPRPQVPMVVFQTPAG